MVNQLLKTEKVSLNRACGLVGISRSGWYRGADSRTKEADKAVQDALNKVVERNPRWGFWKCHHSLRLKGHPWNHKRVWRVYCQMGLNLPRRTRKRIPKRQAQPLEVSAQPNQMWSMDFMHDTLTCGKRFRVLNIIDEGVREALRIEVDTSLPAARVVRVLEQLKQERPLPKQIRADNGPELISTTLINWCEHNGVALHHIQPGKPTQNAYVERFNRTFRTELLDAYLFDRISQVREMVADWMEIYNTERPHDALGNLPPAVFCATSMSSPVGQSGKNNELLLPDN